MNKAFARNSIWLAERVYVDLNIHANGQTVRVPIPKKAALDAVDQCTRDDGDINVFYDESNNDVVIG